jgi:hypothetical protein
MVAGDRPDRFTAPFRDGIFVLPRAISSAGERCLHTAEVAGSKPASPTSKGTILRVQPQNAESVATLSSLLLTTVVILTRGGKQQVGMRLEKGYDGLDRGLIACFPPSRPREIDGGRTCAPEHPTSFA